MTVYRKMRVDSELRRLVNQAIECRDELKLKPCGTDASYRRGCRCDTCRSANNRKHSDDRKRRKFYSDDRIPHGQYGYTNYGCRCDVCSSAHSLKMQRDQDRRLADRDNVPHGTRSGYKAWGCRCERCRSAVEAWERPRSIAIYRKTLDNAHHHRHQWTGPEMEIAARKDLSAREVALMLGRTIYAVGRMRKLLKVDPRYIHAAGAVEVDEVT